ncbi:MAG: single-stranded DNA-binding protein [Oscillospiraceae bacterium]|nr:single-stranded DNA-binding protein [Oscillospiraceae bacterium]
MEGTSNQVMLRGTLAQLPQFSHENHGKKFYTFQLEVARLSGTVDVLEVIAPETVLNTLDLSGGTQLEVTGQLRSFNSRQTTGRKLIISVYAEQMCACDLEPDNQVELSGTICKEPVYRRTPLGREICDVMLAVNRPYRRADYLPCILWGRTAKEVSMMPVGTRLSLAGRLQSREYVKILDSGSEKRMAFEVSAITAAVQDPLHED